jgi:hypothetical protein
MQKNTLFIMPLLGMLLSFCALADHSVTVTNNQLTIDGAKQPQLFGAEVQYFRLRGGYGPNVPRDQVIALWNQALDRVVEAKMNAVSFYIPWDFHEYQEGKFDFTGTADDDGDGQPDYPSRDVLTFIRLIKEHGIRHILVRPGPYINAEWGFLGFGAVPEWFQDKYPNSHMQSSWGWNTKLFDYHNADFQAKTQAWFTAVYNQVLKPNMGPGQPIDFLQIDNETNYQWQSIYNLDYSPNAIAGYRSFLMSRYGNDLQKVNQAHQRNWSSWSSWNDIQAPKQFGQNLGEDQDWYRFHDESIHSYLTQLRRIWEGLGVKEPNVLFTLAESYNAPDQGLLPNYVFRNDAGNTGLMTVNLYPKTFDRPDAPLFNNPFKADLDVKSAVAANAAYWGAKQDWAMGPEIQGGWWRGIDVSAKARQQTYLTVIGHGLKAFFVYYFNEGNNFGVHWGPDRAAELYNDLRSDQNVPDSCQVADLSNAFWGELQARMDKTYMIGFNTRDLMQRDTRQDETLYFDAPLDENAQPRDHFYDLKNLGVRVIAPNQDFLARAVEVQDDVAFVKEASTHVPNGAGINNVYANADWSAGLLGYLMTANVNPRMVIGETSNDSEFAQKLLVHVDTGLSGARTLGFLQKAPGVLNFLSDQLPKSMGFPDGAPVQSANLGRQSVSFNIDANGRLQSAATAGTQTLQMSTAASPLFGYTPAAITAAKCEAILFVGNQQPVGYRCRKPDGSLFVQLGALLFDDFNSSDYGLIADAGPRKVFLQALLRDFNIAPKLQLSSAADRMVAFARTDASKLVWITVKTGSKIAQTVNLQLDASLLPSLAPNAKYRIKNLLSDTDSQEMDAATLIKAGFSVQLEAEGSTVYTVQQE